MLKENNPEVHILTITCICGAPVAQLVKPWPTDLEVPSLSPAQGEIFLNVNEFHVRSSIFWMPDCQIQNSRTGNSRNTRTRNTRRPEQEIPNCQTCGSFLKEKKFRAYQKFFFISNTRAVLSRIPFICCIYQTSLAFLKYFTYLKIPYIPV